MIKSEENKYVEQRGGAGEGDGGRKFVNVVFYQQYYTFHGAGENIKLNF